MRRCLPWIAAPEASTEEERDGHEHLARPPVGAYDPVLPRMTMVPRLPAFYFEKLLDSSPDIVVAVDRAGTIIFYNDGARRTLGYASGEVLGQQVTRLYPDPADARKVMDAMHRGHHRVRARVKKVENVF